MSNLYQWTKEQEDHVLSDAHAAHIQWKGTSVCMDLTCTCGSLLHVDAEFLNGIRCEDCQRVYRVGNRVLVFEVQGELVRDLDALGVHSASDDDM